MTTERAPKTAWCWWCRRAIREDDVAAVRVLVGFDSQWMCETCYSKSDPQIPLDYTEERDDHEGEPAWNGAFDASR
jgi:hypothetical protein